MIVSIVNVDIEVGKPGPKGWSKAVVDYMVDGQRRKQNLMSFTNPQVYKDVTSGKYNGEPVEVTITKNAKGYDEWAAISPSGGSAGGASTSPSPSNGTSAPTATRVTGSNYETAAERARRQVLIVKQSSLAQAVEVLGQDKSPNAYTDLAQVFADWVFEEPDLSDADSN